MREVEDTHTCTPSIQTNIHKDERRPQQHSSSSTLIHYVNGYMVVAFVCSNFTMKLSNSIEPFVCTHIFFIVNDFKNRNECARRKYEITCFCFIFLLAFLDFGSFSYNVCEIKTYIKCSERRAREYKRRKKIYIVYAQYVYQLYEEEGAFATR